MMGGGGDRKKRDVPDKLWRVKRQTMTGWVEYRCDGGKFRQFSKRFDLIKRMILIEKCSDFII